MILMTVMVWVLLNMVPECLRKHVWKTEQELGCKKGKKGSEFWPDHFPVLAEDVEIDVESMVWTLESDGCTHTEVDHCYSTPDRVWLWLTGVWVCVWVCKRWCVESECDHSTMESGNIPNQLRKKTDEETEKDHDATGFLNTSPAHRREQTSESLWSKMESYILEGWRTC